MPKVRNENEMATNVVDADEPDKNDRDDNDQKPSGQSSGISTDSGKKRTSQAFFTIYKNGQGKWTRLGTVFVAGLLAILTAYNLYHYILPYLPGGSHARQSTQILLAICVGFLVAFGLLVFWITNKPANVDFLIATDSEMKKVNWTTKGELLGSTRVVVLFLFFIAIFLFLVDLLFSAFFQWIGVLLKA